MRQWDLVIFDFDGTLFDSREVAYTAACNTFAHYDVDPPSKEIFLREISEDFKDFYIRHGIPSTASVYDLSRIWDKTLRERFDDAKPYKHARKVLDACHNLGMHVAMVSGQLNSLLLSRLTSEGLVDRFKTIVGADLNDPVDKLVALQDMCAKFNVAPENACYVDDTVEGISAAQEAGLCTIGITHGFSTEEAIRAKKPNFICHSLSEVYELLTTLVIGIVGENGGGKDTFAENLFRANTDNPLKQNPHSIPYAVPMAEIRFSDPLKAVLEAAGIPINRTTMQRISPLLRQGYGDRVLADRVRDLALQAPQRIVLLNGVRWEVDLEMVRAWPHNALIYVTAPAEVRFERMQKRARDTAEAGLTREKFLTQERAETEQTIPVIGSQANWIYRNTGTVADLRKNAHAFYAEHLAPTLPKLVCA